MKEASGDMVMTVIVIAGAIFVLFIGKTVIWPAIQGKIINETNKIESTAIIEDYRF